MKNTEEKGITLIALVVTIVVLLILAAVSLNAIVGDNGVMRSAQKAGDSWKKAEEDDNEQLEKLSDYLTPVEQNDYIEGAKLICVYTDSLDVWYKYNDSYMFDLSSSGYAYLSMEYQKVYGILIGKDEEFSKSNIKKVKADEISESQKDELTVNYRSADEIEKYDVNGDKMISYLDAMTLMEVRAGTISTNTKSLFMMDINRNKMIDVSEAMEIMDYLGGNI